MKIRFSNRMPDALFLLALIVSIGVFISTGATAAETRDVSLFSKAGFTSLVDGDVKLAPVGNHGAGLHMTFKSPSRSEHALYVSSNAGDYAMKDHGVHLSVKMPW